MSTKIERQRRITHVRRHADLKRQQAKTRVQVVLLRLVPELRFEFFVNRTSGARKNISLFRSGRDLICIHQLHTSRQTAVEPF